MGYDDEAVSEADAIGWEIDDEDLDEPGRDFDYCRYEDCGGRVYPTHNRERPVKRGRCTGCGEWQNVRLVR